MTAPTQVQIKTANDLVGKWFIWLWATRPAWLKAMPDETARDDLVKRIVALTAAVEVKPMTNLEWEIANNMCVTSESHLTAAAEVRPVTTEQLDKAQFGRVLHDRPAAGVGDKMGPWDDRYSGSTKEIEAHTIERCAQVADMYADTSGSVIATAIRALKDKP